MAKYRKKPVVVEAFQWREPEHHEGQPLPSGVFAKKVATKFGEWGGVEDWEWRFFVVTIHGQEVWLADRDWVLAEPDGEGHYPCKPDIFEATYEKVED